MNRTLCSVLQEMRKAYKTRNFSYLPGLIEEAQSMGNRMEAGLSDKHNIEYYADEERKARRELKKVQKRLKELNLYLPEEEQKDREEY